MYNPQFWIDPAVYPFLVSWSLSTGYEVKTNDPHSLLYEIACFDGIRCSELRAAGEETSLSREKAEQLVENLKSYVGKTGAQYAPDYHPLIKLYEEFATDVFLPALEKVGYKVKWEEWGIYHKINRVTGKAGEVLCRNHVTQLIRELEYEATMTPFLVTYNLLKQRASMSKTWVGKILTDYQNADALMLREKERHAPADWRIYKDVSHIACQETFMSSEFVRCEAWLWLRVYHPNNEGLMGADYWQEGFYEDLGDLKRDMIDIRDEDMYAICAIYACCHHDPLPEKQEPPFLMVNIADEGEKRHKSDVEKWPIMYRVVKPSARTGYKGQITEVAFGYIQEMETAEAVEKLTAMIKDKITRPPFMLLIHRLEVIEKVGG